MASARPPSASNFQPTIFVLGNQPRNSAMIFGVGTSSTSRLPPRVEIFLDGVDGFSFPATSRVKILPKAKIAHRRRVKDGVHLFTGKQFQFRLQIRRGGKSFDRLRPAFARVGRRLANEQRDAVAARGEKIGQLRAEPARGKICEPAHVVQRLISRPGGDDAIHARMITPTNPCIHTTSQTAARVIRRPENRNGTAPSGAAGAGGFFPRWRQIVPARC